MTIELVHRCILERDHECWSHGYIVKLKHRPLARTWVRGSFDSHAAAETCAAEHLARGVVVEVVDIEQYMLDLSRSALVIDWGLTSRPDEPTAADGERIVQLVVGLIEQHW